MKGLFYLSLFTFIVSCQDLVCESRQNELVETWTVFPNEDLRFIPSIGRNVVAFSVVEVVRLGVNDCQFPYETRAIFGQDTITNSYLRGINYQVIGTQDEVKVQYTFLPAEPALTGVPSPETQQLSCLSLLRNQNCEDERAEIGEITINGIPHRNVFSITENETRGEKNIERILVNEKGILRIEFYDGEVWSRIF